MAVLMPDGTYQVARAAHPWPRDAHGAPAPGAPTPVGVPVPGAAIRQVDGSWSLRLDPSAWPIYAGDRLTRVADSRVWVVIDTPRLVSVPGADDVDHVRVSAEQDPPEVDRGWPVSPA